MIASNKVLVLWATSAAQMGLIESYVKDATFTLTESSTSHWDGWTGAIADPLEYGVLNGSYFMQLVDQTPSAARDTYSTNIEYSDASGVVVGLKSLVTDNGPDDTNTKFYFQVYCRDDFVCFSMAIPENYNGTAATMLCTDKTCDSTSSPEEFDENRTPEFYWETDFLLAVGPNTKMAHLYNNEATRFQSSTRMPPRVIETADFTVQKTFSNVSMMATRDVVYTHVWDVVGEDGNDDVLTVETSIKAAGEAGMSCEVQFTTANGNVKPVFDMVNSDCTRVIGGKPLPLIRFNVNYPVEPLSLNIEVDQAVVLGEVSDIIYSKEHIGVPGLPGTNPSEWIVDPLDVVSDDNVTLESVFGDYDTKGRITVNYLFLNESSVELEFIANRSIKNPCQVVLRVSENYDARYSPMLKLGNVSSPQCSFDLSWIDRGVSGIVGPIETVLPQCDGACDNGLWVEDENAYVECPDRI